MTLQYDLATARKLAYDHAPTADGTCESCTWSGVGSHGRPVGAPCDIFKEAVKRRRELGDPELAAEVGQ